MSELSEFTLAPGAIVKVNGIPLELRDAVVALTHPGNFPLLAPDNSQRETAQAGSDTKGG